MLSKAIKAFIVSQLILFPSTQLVAERGDLEDSPVLKDLIQQKFEEIREFRSRLHRWERSIRGFRRDHNFSLMLGASSGRWVGTMPETSGDIDYTTTRYLLRGTYSFHLELGYSVGYFLGTSMGATLSENANVEGFRSPRVYELPGVRLGLTWNLSPGVRVSGGVDVHLTRIDKFYHEAETAVTTSRSLARKLTVDFFVSISQGLRLEYESYTLKVDGGNGVKIQRTGEGVSIGWVRHLI